MAEGLSYGKIAGLARICCRTCIVDCLTCPCNKMLFFLKWAAGNMGFGNGALAGGDLY